MSLFVWGPHWVDPSLKYYLTVSVSKCPLLSLHSNTYHCLIIIAYWKFNFYICHQRHLHTGVFIWLRWTIPLMTHHISDAGKLIWNDALKKIVSSISSNSPLVAALILHGFFPCRVHAPYQRILVVKEILPPFLAGQKDSWIQLDNSMYLLLLN